MVARPKKKAQNKRVFAGPTVLAVQDPRQPPLEVPEESLTRQPPGGPRLESSTMGVILQLLREVSKDIKHLRAEQTSLLSDMAELRTSVGHMNQWLDLAESRFSFLEDRASETHQTKSTVTTSQAVPMGVSTASSSSFNSQQMILDAAQAAVSPSSTSVYPSGEPVPPSASEQFRAASSTLVYSECEEMARQMLAEPWPQETSSESESAHTEDEESGQQEDTFSEESFLIVPEYKTKPQRLISNLLETPQPPSPAKMQKETPLTDRKLAKRHPTNRRSSNSASGSTAPSSRILCRLVSSPPSEAMSPTKRPRASIAWRYFTKHPTSKFIATCNICRTDVKTGKIGGCGKVGTSSLLQHIKLVHHIAQEKKGPSVLPASRSKICSIGRSSITERSRRIRSAASACTATSAASLHSPSLSPPSKVVPPAKHPRTSIAWRYFTKDPTSKFIATCNICGLDVKTGGKSGKVGTAPLLSHIKRIHHIVRKK